MAARSDSNFSALRSTRFLITVLPGSTPTAHSPGPTTIAFAPFFFFFFYKNHSCPGVLKTLKTKKYMHLGTLLFHLCLITHYSLSILPLLDMYHQLLLKNWCCFFCPITCKTADSKVSIYIPIYIYIYIPSKSPN